MKATSISVSLLFGGLYIIFLLKGLGGVGLSKIAVWGIVNLLFGGVYYSEEDITASK